MRLEFFQNIINIFRGKLLYLPEITSKYLEVKDKKAIKTLVLGSSHAMFYQCDENEYNIATSSQDLYYSYHLFEKYGQKADNVILTYSIFSKGLCLIKTKEIELCILLKKIFEIDYQFKNIAKKKKLYLLEPFYKIQIDKYLKNPSSLKKKRVKDDEIYPMNSSEYIKTRALKHYKNYQREENQLEYLEKLLEKTQENNQNLILIIPPAKKLYKESIPNGKEIFKHLFEMCNKYKQVNILDFYNSNLFSEDDFIDSDHLNKDGQIKMTEFIKNRILELKNTRKDAVKIYENI